MSNNHEYPQIYLLQQLFQVLESASTGIDGEINVNDFIPTNIDNPNRNGPNPDSTGTYTVEQMQLYNQPKKLDHVIYIDDNTDNTPYRYVKYYYIYKKGTKKRKNIPLPINHSAAIQRDIVIAGWLQPPPTSTGNRDVEPLFVVLENINARAVIDRSRTNRGYWIEINSSSKKKGNAKKDDTAWYYLQEPCDFKPPDAIESQANVQWDATVVLTCVSVLLDQVLEVDPTRIGEKITDLLQNESLLLLPVESQDIGLEKLLYDFELSIIASYKAMIIQHINEGVTGCGESSTFIISISELKKPKHPPNAVALQLWVRAICLQLHQHLWGGLKSDSNDANIGHPIIKIETSSKHESMVTGNDKLAKKHRKSIDDDDIMFLEESKRSKRTKLETCIKHEKDADTFSAIALKEQLNDDALRIPSIQFNCSMENWTEKTSWESIVADYGSSFMLVGEEDDAKAFFDHIMQKSPMKLESMTLAIYLLTRTAPSSQYYKFLLKKVNEAGRPVTFIFNNLMKRALEILDQRIVRRQSIKQTSAMYMLANILFLFVSRDDFKSKNAISSLMKKADVNLKSSLEEVQCCIDIMTKHSLDVPEYLKESIMKAESTLSDICDSVRNGKVDPLPVPVERNDKKEFVKSGHVHTSKREESHSISVKQGSKYPGSAQQNASMKIPRKSSIDNAPLMVDTAKQTPTGSRKATDSKPNPPKVNLAKLLAMKGITKEVMGESMLTKKVDPLQHLNLCTKQNSTDSNYTVPKNRNPPPVQQWNGKDQTTSWESKNICGWGDVQDITKESSESIKTFPTLK